MRVKIILFSLCWLYSHMVMAEREFCLSGGYSSGYSCDFENAAGSRKAVYSLQFLANTGTEDKLLKRLDFLNLTVLDSAIVSERQHFYYLGEYTEEKTAWHALDRVNETLGNDTEKYRPELVSYTREYNNTLPRIRLVERGVLAGQPLVVEGDRKTAERLQAQQVAPTAMAKNNQPMTANKDELVRKNKIMSGAFYTVQLAAFGSREAGERFAESYPNYTLYCRKKNNGLYANYLGVFDGYTSARDYLHSVKVFDRFKPYVVQLTDVELKVCGMS